LLEHRKKLNCLNEGGGSVFYYDKIKKKNITYKQYNYATFSNGLKTDYDERLLPVKFATSTYNYCYQNGALKTGLGVKKLELCYDINDKSKTKEIELPDGVQAVASFIFTKYNYYTDMQEDMLIVYGSDKYIYAFMMYDQYNSFAKLEVQFTRCPMFVNYHYNGNDCMLIATEEEGLYIWDSYKGLEKIEDAPIITSLCMHYERLFVTTGKDKRSIWFSDDMDPTNWSQSLTEGGFINLIDDRGTSNKIISFNDYLFVFREYGIDKIIAYANQTDFQVVPLFTSSTKIYTDTIRVCGDRVVFLAKDGIYYFTGLSTVKYNLDINNLFVREYNDNAISAYYDGKYYLACKLNLNDDEIVGCENSEYTNNVLIELDIRTGELNILRGYDIVNVQTLNNKIESKLIVCIKDNGMYKLGELTKDGKVYGVPTKKVWRSPLSCFGIINQDKLLKSITIVSESDISIIVRYDSQTKTFDIKGSIDPITIYPNIKAKEIAIDFISNKENVYISNPQVVVGYL